MCCTKMREWYTKAADTPIAAHSIDNTWHMK
jgi:hypothetical protein